MNNLETPEIAISLSIGTQELAPQVNRIIEVCAQRNVSPVVVLAGHLTLDPLGSEKAIETTDHFPSGIVVPALADEGTFSMAYLKGWQTGSELATNVISLDADGSHDPMQILDFIDALRRGHQVVLGSRNLPESKNKYPIQRRMVSNIGTLVANTFLNPTSQSITDFTSGFEAMSSDVIRAMFANTPASQWISAAHGPYHLQNTELRMNLLSLGYPIHEIPITYGIERSGKSLKLGYIFKAFYGFTLLVKNCK